MQLLLIISLLVIGASASKDKTKDTKTYDHGIVNTDDNNVLGFGDIALIKITRRLGDLNLDQSKQNVADEILQNAKQSLKICTSDYKTDQNIARYRSCVGTNLGMALRQIGYLERSVYNRFNTYNNVLDNDNALNRIRTFRESDLRDYDVDNSKKVGVRKININDQFNLNRDHPLYNSQMDERISNINDQVNLNRDQGLWNSRFDDRNIQINDQLNLNRDRALSNSRLDGRKSKISELSAPNRDYVLSNSRLDGRRTSIADQGLYNSQIDGRSIYMNDQSNLNRDRELSSSSRLDGRNSNIKDQAYLSHDQGLANSRVNGPSIYMNDQKNLNRYRGLSSGQLDDRNSNINNLAHLSHDQGLSNSRSDGRSIYMNDQWNLNRDQGLSNTNDYLTRNTYDVGLSNKKSIVGGDRDIYGRGSLQSAGLTNDWNIDNIGRYQRSINYNDDLLSNLGNLGWYRLVFGIKYGGDDSDISGRAGNRQNIGDIYGRGRYLNSGVRDISGRYGNRGNLISSSDNIYDGLETSQSPDLMKNILVIRGQLDNYEDERDIYGRIGGGNQKIRGQNLYSADNDDSDNYNDDYERDQKLSNDHRWINNYKSLDYAGADKYNTDIGVGADTTSYGDNYRRNLYSGMRHSYDPEA